MQIETTLNVSDDVLFGNIFINSRKPVKWVKSLPAHDGHAVLVGGGPSVADWIREIRTRKEMGQTIFALNGAAKLLHDHGIIPDHLIVVDARFSNVKFLGYAEHSYLASQCHPALFEALDPGLMGGVTLWHQQYPDDMARFDASIPPYDDDYSLVGGGTSVGLSAMALAHILGYRKLHLYGYDSSYRDGHTHAYDQHDPQSVPCKVTAAGRTFETNLSMHQQATEFPKLSDMLLEAGSFITIRGDGLLPWVSKASTLPPLEITEQEKYRQMWAHDAYRAHSPGEEIAGWFVEIAGIKASTKVVEFGCGTGRGGQAIKRICGAEVTQLDFEDFRDLTCKDMPFIAQDLAQMGFENRWDVGYCTDVMEHLPMLQVDMVIRNIMRAVPACFFQIALIEDSMGTLIGQKLHLTVESFSWWIETFQHLGYRIKFAHDQGINAIFHISST